MTFRTAVAAFLSLIASIHLSAQDGLMGLAEQQDHHIVGVFPTLDIGFGWDQWYAEVYAFSATVPFAQYRSLDSGPMTVILEQEYGPGASIGGVVFNYAEFDLTRDLGKGWSATASYTYEAVPMAPVMDVTRTEHRFWLQAKRSFELGNSTFWGRGRMDFRSIQNLSADIEGEPSRLYRPRARAQFGWSRPVGDGPWGLVANAEAFVELWDVDAEADGKAFREQWSAFQVSNQLKDNLRVEAGPLLISWWSPDGYKHWLHTWYLQAALFIDLTPAE